jgi:hypothetical protein
LVFGLKDRSEHSGRMAQAMVWPDRQPR